MSLRTLANAKQNIPPLSTAEEEYINKFYIANMRSKDDPSFRKMVLDFCASVGWTSAEKVAKITADAEREEQAEREAEANKRAQAERQAKAEEQAAKERMRTAIPAKYRGEEYNREYWPELAGALAGSLARAACGYPPQDLYIHGVSHTGKSHGAAALVLDLADLGRSVSWVSCPRLRNLYEDGITDKAKRVLAQSIKQEAIGADVTVLDDIGKDDTSSSDRRTLSFFGRALYEIIEERLGSKNRLTIFTSEFAPSDLELKKRLTDAIVNRVTDKCAIVGDAPAVIYAVWRQAQAELFPVVGNAQEEKNADTP